MNDLNTITLHQTEQEPDRVILDAYGDGSAVWLGLASDDPDKLTHADLEPQEARRLAFRLLVAADAAEDAAISDVARELRVSLALDTEVVPAVAALRERFVGPSQEYVVLPDDLRAPCTIQTGDHEYALLADDDAFEPSSVPEGPIVRIRRPFLYAKIAEACEPGTILARIIDALQARRPERIAVGGFFADGLVRDKDDPAVPVCPIQHLTFFEGHDFSNHADPLGEFDFTRFDTLMGKQPAVSHVCEVID